MRSKERGLNLIELQIAIGILLLIWGVIAYSVFSRFGFQWKSILAVASPAILLGGSFLTMSACDSLRARGSAGRVKSLLHLLEAGDTDQARRAFLALPETPEIRHAMRACRARVVAAIAGPWPAREIAYRLHLRLNDRFLEDLSRPLLESITLWPENLFAPVLADIARRADAREAAGVLLGRSPTELRASLLGSLFGLLEPVAPQEPTSEWLELLRPHRAELEQVLRRADYQGAPQEHLRRYLKAMV